MNFTLKLKFLLNTKFDRYYQKFHNVVISKRINFFLHDEVSYEKNFALYF